MEVLVSKCCFTQANKVNKPELVSTSCLVFVNGIVIGNRKQYMLAIEPISGNLQSWVSECPQWMGDFRLPVKRFQHGSAFLHIISFCLCAVDDGIQNEQHT